MGLWAMSMRSNMLTGAGCGVHGMARDGAETGRRLSKMLCMAARWPTHGRQQVRRCRHSGSSGSSRVVVAFSLAQRTPSDRRPQTRYASPWSRQFDVLHIPSRQYVPRDTGPSFALDPNKHVPRQLACVSQQWRPVNRASRRLQRVLHKSTVIVGMLTTCPIACATVADRCPVSCLSSFCSTLDCVRLYPLYLTRSLYAGIDAPLDTTPPTPSRSRTHSLAPCSRPSFPSSPSPPCRRT